eukprot:g197.t1
MIRLLNEEHFLCLGWWFLKKLNAYLTGTGVAALLRVLEHHCNDTSFFKAVHDVLPSDPSVVQFGGHFFISRNGGLGYLAFRLQERLQDAILRRNQQHQAMEEMTRAVASKDYTKLNVLLAAWAGDPGEGSGVTPLLHVAIDTGDAAMVNFLLCAVPALDPDLLRDGKTPLMIAAQNNDVGVLRSLLDHGAGVNVKDLHGNSALDWAIMDGGRVNTSVKILESNGAIWGN